MSQTELAQRANLQRTYVSDIERGARNISMRSALRISAALTIPLWQLIQLVEELAAV